MHSNAMLLNSLNRILADLNEDQVQTLLVIHAAPVLTRPDFIARLEALVPHTMLVVLGEPTTDAPADAFPCAVGLFTGPIHDDIARHGWTQAGGCWWHPTLAQEFGLQLPSVTLSLSNAPAAGSAREPVESIPDIKRLPDPLPPPSALKPPKARC